VHGEEGSGESTVKARPQFPKKEPAAGGPGRGKGEGSFLEEPERNRLTLSPGSLPQLWRKPLARIHQTCG
jgi:hypothetical protein